MRILLLISLFVAFFGFSQKEKNISWKLDVKNVPNQRILNGSCITDEANILSDSITSILDASIKSHEDSTSNQVAIVCLDSIGAQGSRQFGTDLFNLWGIGQKEKDNGFLILIIMNIHQIEFITGYGIEDVLTDENCIQIIKNVMAPQFKKGDFESGVFAALMDAIDTLEGNPPDYLKE